MISHAKHYAEGQSPRLRGAILAAIVAAAAALAILCAYGCDAAGRANKAATYQETYVPGQPLDAVRLSAPSWSDWEYMWRVGDRTSGACWYRVHVDGKWEVYLICEGYSYVRQQQEEAR